jgi:hypothetical protein
MDSDGWISERKNGMYTKYEVGFKNTSMLSSSIYEMMKMSNLQCNKLEFRKSKRYNKECKSVWTWTINTRSFLNEIGFGIERKCSIGNKYFQYILKK